jgi:hypothetical protein
MTRKINQILFLYQIKNNILQSFETHYNIIVQKYGQMPQAELIESLSNGTIDLQQGENGHHLGNGFLCGLLVEPANAEKVGGTLMIVKYC